MSKRMKYQILSGILLAIFLGCAGWLLYDYVYVPFHNSGITGAIARTYHEIDSSPSSSADSVPEATHTPIAELQQTYPALTAWIQIPNTVIDYPVMQADASSSDFYLTHDYTGATSRYGSIFMDAMCSLQSKNMILYGHHMRDGQMFASLVDLGNLDGYSKSPVFTLDTVDGKTTWKIFSIFKANVDPSQGVPFEYLKADFSSESDFMNFVYQVWIRSIIRTGVDVQPGDRLLTLSTCSYEFDDFRTVVVAREVREGEDASVDTANASLSDSTLYPDCWYKKYGGKVPTWPDTYEDALADGQINW